jgi:hypothetical protein
VADSRTARALLGSTSIRLRRDARSIPSGLDPSRRTGGIQGDDSVPLGKVPLDWCDQRLIGTAAADGDYADIYSSGWIAHLRPKLADECLRLGLQDLDAAVLQDAAPRPNHRL